MPTFLPNFLGWPANGALSHPIFWVGRALLLMVVGLVNQVPQRMVPTFSPNFFGEVSPANGRGFG